MTRKLIPGDLVCLGDLAGDYQWLTTRPSGLLITTTSQQGTSGYMNMNSVAVVLAVDGIAVTCVYVLSSNGGGWCPAALLKKTLNWDWNPTPNYSRLFLSILECHNMLKIKQLQISRPHIGDRVVVANLMSEFVVIEDIVDLRREEARIKYVLKWSSGGQSYVYDHDENVVWYRYDTNN